MPSDINSNGDLPANVLPKIMVLGVGGAGVNVVDAMIVSQLEAVKFVVANTDCQSLVKSLADTKIQLGAKCTKGLGAGSNPDIGKQAAEEAIDLIKRELSDTDMLFIATGMGGGTGTGASPVIAKIARDMGVLTVAIAIKPFAYEGKKRMETANKGIAEIEKLVDTLIIIENEKVASLNNVSLAENYTIVNNILRHAVCCVVDILTKTGYVNRDFADVRTVLASCGRAVIGYGEDTDPCVAIDTAIHNPILTNCSINGAKNILVNITGNRNLKSTDIQAIIDKIYEEAKTEPNIIPGIIFDEAVGDNIRVSIIAAGVETINTETAEKNNTDKQAIHNQTANKTTENNELHNVKPVDSPVFARKIDENDIVAEFDGFNVEEIPINLNDNVVNFTPNAEKNQQMDDKKKKISKTDNNVSNSLFDDTTKKHKEGIFGKMLNMITPTSSVFTDNDVENIFNNENENEQKDIYNTPAIKRKLVNE